MSKTGILKGKWRPVILTLLFIVLAIMADHLLHSKLGVRGYPCYLIHVLSVLFAIWWSMNLEHSHAENAKRATEFKQKVDNYSKELSIFSATSKLISLKVPRT